MRGEVRFDAGYRAIYSNDSSNYRQQAIGVVVPADQDDVVAAMAACREHDAPVLPRGCGTSLSGETVNHAVVIDVSRNLRAIKEIDARGALRDRRARRDPRPAHRDHRAADEPHVRPRHLDARVGDVRRA